MWLEREISGDKGGVPRVIPASEYLRTDRIGQIKATRLHAFYMVLTISKARDTRPRLYIAKRCVHVLAEGRAEGMATKGVVAKGGTYMYLQGRSC